MGTDRYLLDEGRPLSARHAFLALALILALSVLTGRPLAAGATPREVFFGDTHLHTSWSPDALLFGNRTADPDTAYRFAKGLPVIHPNHRARVRIGTPLDFLAVSDHAEFMGVIPMIFKNDPRVANSETARRFQKLAAEGRANEGFGILLQQVATDTPDPALVSPDVARSVWAEILAAAERHNDPGRFTTLVAWEWSSMPDMANLHRIVLVREGEEVASRFYPFSSLGGKNRPEDLWDWLEKTSKETGAHFLAIPHNSNISRGRMFERTTTAGDPVDAAYAERRLAWEPIVEVTQVKGDSETLASLSPLDEFADYETFGQMTGPSKDLGADYVRSALRRGLEIEAETGSNPYAFGLIGSTDSHTGLSTAEENNFLGKFAYPSTPEENLKQFSDGRIEGLNLGASGLAAVWAEENTREALFDAFRRKEVYATTGTRLRVRFFGGWKYRQRDLESGDSAERGYAKGVPMGGTLPARDGNAPRFMIQAEKDPLGANLDRLQIVKGWVDAMGKSHERVYDVALADGRELTANGKAPPVGNTVDLATATYANTIGDTQLATLWEDPDFDASQSAFYYVRALEIPTPRHSLYDAVAVGVPHPERRPAFHQERAYTSPIYYRPEDPERP